MVATGSAPRRTGCRLRRSSHPLPLPRSSHALAAAGGNYDVRKIVAVKSATGVVPTAHGLPGAVETF